MRGLVGEGLCSGVWFVCAARVLGSMLGTVVVFVRTQTYVCAAAYAVYTNGGRLMLAHRVVGHQL